MTDINAQAMEFPAPAAEAAPSARARFIQRTYLHLAGAILAFVGIEAVILNTSLAEQIAGAMFRVSWIFILLAWMAVSWVAEKWARSSASPGMQYLGLALFTVAEAIFFVPILYLAKEHAPDVISNAATLTLILFGALTSVVLFTRKDFSFLRSILAVGSFVALGLIVVGVLTGFSLGLWFAVAMIAFASGAILYDTSNILHHHRTDQHVAASLSLFASVALLFWYIILLVLSFRD